MNKPKVVNLYQMGQNIIAEKEAFKKRFSGFEHTYNKKDKDIHEEHIMEMEENYINLCKKYNDEPLHSVLAWNLD